MNKLINTWLIAQDVDVQSDEYDAVSWAVDELFVLAHDDPNRLVSIIEEILKTSSSEKILGVLGAGVLEDLLVHNGDNVIDKIAALSKSNGSFNKALQFTYIDRNDVSNEVYEIIQKLKAQ